jgi:hypothetical protein
MSTNNCFWSFFLLLLLPELDLATSEALELSSVFVLLLVHLELQTLLCRVE